MDFPATLPDDRGFDLHRMNQLGLITITGIAAGIGVIVVMLIYLVLSANQSLTQ
jgi:hypothetical protein